MDATSFLAGRLISDEGKTKNLYEAVDAASKAVRPDLVVLRNKPHITAHDDPTLTRQFTQKGIYATTTTCRVFEFLRACGLSVAYKCQLSETDFLAYRGKMVSLECIVRRQVVSASSYLKRCPHLAGSLKEPSRPLLFPRLRTEFFLKTKGKRWGSLELGTDDPFIPNPLESTWQLFHPKMPPWESGAQFGTIQSSEVLSDVGFKEPISLLEERNRKIFLALELAWRLLGYTLVDLKCEFDSELNLSDVVDSDSWRLQLKGEAFDKQLFRDGGEQALAEVERKYGIIARLSEFLRVPRQTLVLWCGSDADEMPTVPNLPGVEVIQFVQSGHKATMRSLENLLSIQASHPGTGVVVDKVGLSNGLGPILATHSAWPIISIPATLKAFPDDVWSHLRMPSQTPNLVAGTDDCAVNAALNILGLTNPAVYMHQQYMREELDSVPTSLLPA